jgi:hypothetical protein
MKVLATVAALLILIASNGSLAAATDDDKRFYACRDKLKLAQKNDLLYDLQWSGDTPPLVVVGPIFEPLPFDAKQGFADTVNCLLMAGRSGKFINFDLLDWRTHKRVARYQYGKIEVD